MKNQHGNLLLEYLIASTLSILLLVFSINEFQRCFQSFQQLDNGLTTLNQIQQLHLLIRLDIENAGLTGCSRYLSNEPIKNLTLLKPLFNPNPSMELLDEKQAKSLFKIKTAQPVLAIKKTILLGISFKNASNQISLSLNNDELPKVGDVLLLTNCQQLKLFKINYIRKSGEKYNLRFDDKLPTNFLNYLEVLRPEWVIYYNEIEKNIGEKSMNTLSRKEFYWHRYMASELFTTANPVLFSLITDNGQSLLEMSNSFLLFNQTRTLQAVYGGEVSCHPSASAAICVRH